MRKNSKFQIPDFREQSGVTLIIAIVLLAATTSISFAISSIILREIRGTRLVLQTEPAISAANAGGEVGLYRLIRDLGQVRTTGATPESGASYQVVPDLYDNPYVFAIGGGNILRVGLYDAENTANQNADYGRATVTNYSGSPSGPLQIRVYSWSETDNPVCVSGGALLPGGTFTCSLTRPDDRYLIELEASGQDVRGEIQAFDNSDNPKGVPSESPSLEVTGRNLEVRRKIKIELNRQ